MTTATSRTVAALGTGDTSSAVDAALVVFNAALDATSGAAATALRTTARRDVVGSEGSRRGMR